MGDVEVSRAVGLRRRRPVSPDERVKIVRARLVDGLRVSEISRRFSIAPSAVYRYLDEFRRRGPASPEIPPSSTTHEVKHLRDLVAELIRENAELRLALRKSST